MNWGIGSCLNLNCKLRCGRLKKGMQCAVGLVGWPAFFDYEPATASIIFWSMDH